MAARRELDTWIDANERPAQIVVNADGSAVGSSSMSAAAAASDNIANPTAGGVLSFLLGWTGSVWERIHSTAGALQVGGDVGLEASEAHAAEVGWSQGDIYINPTVTAGAEGAGDVLGGLQTLTNFMRVSGGAAQVYGVTLVDVSNSKPTLDFFLFNQSPTASIADNAAWAWNAADYAKLAMHFRVDATEWTSSGSSGRATCSKALSGFPVTASGSANLYLYIVTLNAVTFAATTDLHVRFGDPRA